MIVPHNGVWMAEGSKAHNTECIVSMVVRGSSLVMSVCFFFLKAIENNILLMVV